MDRYEKAFVYFYKQVLSGDIDDEQKEIYKTAIDVLEAQRNAGVIQLNRDYWVSKDGIIYDFKDMSKEYLKNTITMLRRSYSEDVLRNSTTFKGLCQEYLLRD